MNDFERLMQKLGIDVNKIEVIEPEIVHPKNVDRYYEWLQKTGNIYLCDNEKISNSFEKIPDYEKQRF